MKSTIRIAILAAIALAGFVLFFGQEQDESTLTFLLHFLFDKSIGAICLIAFHRLYLRWSRTDPWLIAYNRWCDSAVSATDLDKT